MRVLNEDASPSWNLDTLYLFFSPPCGGPIKCFAHIFHWMLLSSYTIRSLWFQRNLRPLNAIMNPFQPHCSRGTSRDPYVKSKIRWVPLEQWCPGPRRLAQSAPTPPPPRFFFFFWVAKINVDRINKRVSKRRRTCRSFQHVRFDGIIPTVRLIVACPPVCWYSAFGSPQQVRISFRNLIFLGY